MWSKGVWRFVSEKDSLWARVLKGRADQGEDIMRNRWTSSWWKEVREVCSNDYHQDWFWKALQRRVGNGENALFWKDVGLRQEEIGTRYSRLLAVSSQANCRINEVGRWEGETWRWDLKWWRSLFVWEEQLKSDILSALETVRLIKEEEDSWGWEDNKIFIVKGAYDVLQDGREFQMSDFFKQLWRLKAPSKILVFGWRVALSKIPTMFHLKHRGIMGPRDDSKCPLCKEGEETISHPFLVCRVAATVWYQCAAWCGVQTAIKMEDSYWQVSSWVQGNDARLAWSDVWLETIWTIWLQRNDIVFNYGNLSYGGYGGADQSEVLAMEQG